MCRISHKYLPGGRPHGHNHCGNFLGIDRQQGQRVDFSGRSVDRGQSQVNATDEHLNRLVKSHSSCQLNKMRDKYA